MYPVAACCAGGVLMELPNGVVKGWCDADLDRGLAMDPAGV